MDSKSYIGCSGKREIPALFVTDCRLQERVVRVFVETVGFEYFPGLG